MHEEAITGDLCSMIHLTATMGLKDEVLIVLLQCSHSSTLLQVAFTHTFMHTPKKQLSKVFLNYYKYSLIIRNP